MPTSPLPIRSDPASLRELLARCGMLAIGLVLNCSLVLVTIRSKYLRSHCNMLIAFEAAFLALYELNVFVTLAITFGTETGTIGIRHCCLWVQPLFVAAIYSSYTTMLLVSLDRLISMLFPIYYFHLTRRQNKFYLLLMFGTCFAASVYNLQAKFRWVLEEEQRDIQVVCYLNDCNGSYNSALSQAQQAITQACTVFTYICLWALLRWKNSESAQFKLNVQSTRKIFTALAILTAVYGIGNILPATFRIFLPYIQLGPNELRFIIFILSFVAFIPQLINVPVLVFSSSEYRKAYKHWLSTDGPTEVEVNTRSVFHHKSQAIKNVNVHGRHGNT